MTVVLASPLSMAMRTTITTKVRMKVYITLGATKFDFNTVPRRRAQGIGIGAVMYTAMNRT